jgi:hypothetical protein
LISLVSLVHCSTESKIGSFCEGIMWTDIVCLLFGRNTKIRRLSYS